MGHKSSESSNLICVNWLTSWGDSISNKLIHDRSWSESIHAIHDLINLRELTHFMTSHKLTHFITESYSLVLVNLIEVLFLSFFCFFSLSIHTNTITITFRHESLPLLPHQVFLIYYTCNMFYFLFP